MAIDIYDFKLTIWQKRHMPQAPRFHFSRFLFYCTDHQKARAPRKNGTQKARAAKKCLRRGQKARRGGGAQKVRDPQKRRDPESAGSKKAWVPRKRCLRNQCLIWVPKVTLEYCSHAHIARNYSWTVKVWVVKFSGGRQNFMDHWYLAFPDGVFP